MRLRPSSRVALLALSLLATSALADERREARRHFRVGMSLIAQKQYEEGIRELEQAYAIRPHPNVLYNIGQAYLEAGNGPQALELFRRYLAHAPQDAQAVEAKVRELEARLEQKKPQLPPMPPPPLSQGQAVAGTSPALPEAQQRALTELLGRLETAVQRAEALSTTGTPGTLPPAPEATAKEAEALEEDVGDASAAPYEEQVVTASRRAQSTLEAPYATTVITAEDIRRAGATTLYDVLRRVPGAEVMTMGVGSANLSFRGFNQRLGNKVLLLVDGRTEYQDFLGLTLWSALPVGLEEIERIEVIRGPGSALYGANAMLGVVNVITRAPGTGRPVQVQGTFGAGNSAGGSFVASGNERGLRYRASAGYQQADKWSQDFAADRPDVINRAEDPNLALRSARGNLTTTYRFNDAVELGVSGGVNRLFTEFYPLGLLRNYSIDGVSGYAKADLTTGPLKTKIFWNHLTIFHAGPQYEAVGQRSLQASMQSNVFDAETVFSQRFSLLGEHRINLGASTRLKRVGWTYMDGLRAQLHFAAFVEDEWRVLDSLRLVASYRVDRHPLLNQGKPGFAQSPRVSALWQPVEGHAFRVSAASAFREPTFLESYLALRVPAPGVPGASVLTQGSTTLRPEWLRAFELGYRGESASAGIDWDVALYQHTVSDLINLTAVNPLPADQAWDAQTGSFLLGRSSFQNESPVYTARGVEAGVHLSPVDGLDVQLSGALQSIGTDATDTVCGPCLQAPGAKVYGSVSYRTPSRVEMGLEGGYVSSSIWVEREAATDDPTRVVFQQNGLPGYGVVHARLGFEPIPDRLGLELRGTHLGQGHQQHPFGNQIERRVFLTVRVTP